MTIDQYSLLDLPTRNHDYLHETFGHIHPTIQERTQKMTEFWDSWQYNELKINCLTNRRKVAKLLKQIGLVEMQHFQVRYQQVRFVNVDYKAFALFTIGEYVDV